MTYQYYGNNQSPDQGNPFTIQQPEQQQSPFGMMQGLQSFMPMMGMPSGAGAGSSGSGAAAAGGTAASGSGGTMASALSSGGPWALLAAAIIANESEAKKAGRRPQDHKTWARQLVTGKVLQEDMNYYGDKVGGPGGEALRLIGQAGNPEGLGGILKEGLNPIKFLRHL